MNKMFSLFFSLDSLNILTRGQHACLKIAICQTNLQILYSSKGQSYDQYGYNEMPISVFSKGSVKVTFKERF